MTDGNHDRRPSSNRTAQESVARRIRHLILSRTLAPGERLVQSELAEQLGVSRTPIREALHRLESDGLVKLSPHKGASVADLSISELKDIYSIRTAVEGYGAYLAARNAKDQDLVRLESLLNQMREVFEQGDRWHLLEVNRKFYSVLYARAQQPRLYAMIMKHIDLADMYRRMAFAIDHYYRNAIADQEQLLITLKRRDSEAAEHLTREQLHQTLSSLILFLEQTAPV